MLSPAHRDLAREFSELANRGASAELFVGERITPPPARSRKALPLAVLLAIGGTAGWAEFGDPATWHEKASAWVAPLLAGPKVEVPSAPGIPERPPAIASAEPARDALPQPAAFQAPPVAAPAATTEAAVEDAAPAAEAEPAQKPEPLPPPVVDMTDPHQRKAIAAGLHPELSRALLAKLTTADYRNARFAISTALAETPDDAVFVWPPETKPGHASFKVHFVAGAPATCRRYVVAVGYDGWSTTALPMERCNIAKPRSAAAQGAGKSALVRPSSQ